MQHIHEQKIIIVVPIIFIDMRRIKKFYPMKVGYGYNVTKKMGDTYTILSLHILSIISK